ncbi:hypothetical protein F5Y03DRAFT_294900 [Xylaria venustula]|nr:hypothetical protein F5Y03DRAFT_294900 [Xylaria venustula]
MKTASLTPNINNNNIIIKIPKVDEERVILHFDYDCFYASVFENENPSLKSQPLGIKQKSILATCNYVARARGVRKLMLISEAQKICPDLVLMNGEDLTRFRDASKKLWTFLRAHSWNDRVERLGLDEVFLDVTDVVAYNRELLNVHALEASFFQLDRHDPVKGFAFDGSRFYGRLQPDAEKQTGNGGEVVVDVEDQLCVRLMLASHLAGYLRHKLDEDFGYTSSGGVSTNKLLAKLVGSVNKPNNQTTLLATGGRENNVAAFMDAHNLRKVPGIGSRTAQLIEEHVLSRATSKQRDREGLNNVTVGDLRLHPGMSADLLEQILDRPGAERGSGQKIWNLLHGVDTSEVKTASDVPTQISIEDTYMSRPLQTSTEVHRELCALATSLIRRMRVDLTEVAVDIDAGPQNSVATATTGRWLAYPKTLRLSTRTKPKQTAVPATGGGAEVPNFSRSSRSAPLPSFVFQFISTSQPPLSTSAPSPSTALSSEEIGSRLATESLIPLFRRLHPGAGGGGWNIALLNICVTNMVIVARDSGSGSGSGSSVAPGRDIGRMFRTQEDKLREWTVYDTSPALPPLSLPPENNADTLLEDIDMIGESINGYAEKGEAGDGEEDVQFHRDSSGSLLVDGDGDKHGAAQDEDDGGDDGDDNNLWEDEGEGSEDLDTNLCQVCGHAIPVFAISAHERFHAMDE